MEQIASIIVHGLGLVALVVSLTLFYLAYMEADMLGQLFGARAWLKAVSCAIVLLLVAGIPLLE